MQAIPPAPIRTSRRGTALLASALLIASACGDDVTGPGSEPVRLEISPLHGTLAPGATTSLSASWKDGSGRVVEGPPVQWLSRDTTTAIVDQAGILTAVRMGEAWVTATAGSLSDSILVDVRSSLLPGEARVRARGVDDFEILYDDARAAFIDFLGHDEADFFQALLSKGGSGDTLVLGFQPGVIRPGITPMDDWDPSVLWVAEDGRDFPGAGVAVLIDEPTGSSILALLSSTPSRLEVDVHTGTPGPGTVEGSFTARIVAELRRYRIDVDFEGFDARELPGRDTLYVDMRSNYFHLPVGTSSGRMDGGGGGTWDLRETWWSDRYDGLYGIWVEDGPPNITGITPSRFEGTIPIGSDVIADGGAGLQARVEVSSWTGDPYRAVSTSGEWEITRFAPANEWLYGEVVGRIDAHLDARPWDGGASFPIDVSLEFHVPVFPKDSSTPMRSSIRLDGPVARIPLLARWLP